MYQKAYKEIVQDDLSAERANEAMAIDHAISMMKEGEKDITSVEAVKALHFTRRLWLYFLDDLSSPENSLPDARKAHLISRGIWGMRELDRIANKEHDSFADLIHVMELIRDGLK